MKLISWNVNGFRAARAKGFDAVFSVLNADIFCLQETKLQPEQADFSPEGYTAYWNSAQRKGYSGTAVFTRRKPLSVFQGFAPTDPAPDAEGRVLTLEFEAFFLVNAYAPNSQSDLARLPFRLAWEDAMRAHLCALQRQKPVVYCGDLNVAHTELDLRAPEANRGATGFSDEEREKLSRLLQEAGLLDTFRAFHPDEAGAYTWWSYLHNERAVNDGWRIDYVLISKLLGRSLQQAFRCPDIPGSDHCPVGVLLNL